MAQLDASLLTTLPPFSQLSQAQIREILDQASSKRYAVETEIFREGYEADRFYLLLDGHLRVVRTTVDGEQIIALHIPPGQLFGIAPALQRDTYPATAFAASEALALSWPVRLWQPFVQNYPGFATESYKTLGGRLDEMQTRITELATQGVERRVAAALLRLVSQSGSQVEGGVEIAFPITRKNISDMTGTTLHTVSRLLSAWEKAGTVRSARKRIVVTDTNRLSDLSSSAG
ncbi:Crp/Fnr family transcriptional regulator [Pseudophaeobacter sp.]|uniref:Crp/Fnr family transcriptional regulator n=1 Tax=Pseudophaeobacter sp. TaxID=1971739 RepID=UPI003298CF13